MAFNLYCNGTPSVFDIEDSEERLKECRCYTVEDLFCCGYARYFWEAVKIRYPEYCFYVDMEDLYAENQDAGDKKGYSLVSEASGTEPEYPGAAGFGDFCKQRNR